MDTKYFTDLENIEATLDNYGVAIIPSLLDENECNNMINDMWDYLEHITKKWSTPIDRNDQNSWEKIYDLNKNLLIFQFWNIGHSQLCWNVRQNPKIVNVFSKIYNVEPTELVSSFDGASIQFPPEITGFGWREDSKPWFHVDHSYIDSKFKNYQAWITAYDINENDATLVFLESSHLYHKECGDMLEIKSPKDFTMLNKDQLDFYLSKCEKKYVIAPKGSLVIWDSRTVHYGCEPSNKRTELNSRCISYLCYAPKSKIDEDNYEKRECAFKYLYTTNHDPINVTFKYLTPFADEDQDVELFITKINKPILTDLGISLVN
jgi:ectoine hydroxylase-related dioxygenase (phytanoyl-CoA dioxygenase family)